MVLPVSGRGFLVCDDQRREFQSRRVLEDLSYIACVYFPTIYTYIFQHKHKKNTKRIVSQASREAFPKMSGRGRGFRGKHSGRGRGSKKSSSDPRKNPKKSLQDYVYYIGSAKQASDFTTTTEYIINYIRRTFTQGNDIANALETREEVNMTDFMPVLQQSVEQDPTKAAIENKQYEILYRAEISKYVERSTLYEANKDKAFALLFAQCNKALQNKIISRVDYEVDIKGNPIELLDAIEEHAMSYMENKYDALIVLESLKSLFSLRQREDEDLVDFTKRFKSATDVAESHIGEKLRFMKLAKADEEWTSIDADIQEECYKRAYDKVIALLYMMNSDQTKYGSLLSGLSTQFALKQDQYPKSITHATSILSDHKFDESYYAMRKKRKEKADAEKEKKDQQLTSDPELNFSQLEGVCYCCGKKGHKSPQCKHNKRPKSEWVINKTKEAAFITQAAARSDEQSVVTSIPQPTPIPDAQQAASNVQQGEARKFDWMAVALAFDQHHENQMRNWVLLDTGSTVNVFCNPNMVKNIKKAEKSLPIHTNAGIFEAEYTAELPWTDMKVWFDPNAVANVLSMGMLQEKYQVRYDNSKEDTFFVETPKGVIPFRPLTKYLYVYKPNVPEMNMLSTLKENKRFYTRRQIDRAKRARDLSRALGCPSDEDLKKILKMNFIKDCPVIEEDVDLAEKIFGKDIAVLKGKTSRKTPGVVIQDIVTIPPELKLAQKEVTLCIDTFYVNKMPFFHTISEKINYRTTQWVPQREVEQYQKALEVILKIYVQAGFHVAYICADREFEPVLTPMRDEFGFQINLASAQEHVPTVERSIRTVKERIRATIHGNPFKAIPRVLIKAVVQECTRKLNFFPSKHGCSAYYSPREILHGKKLNYEHECKIPQLSYVLVHDEPTPTNSMKPRALDGIYVRPISNAQGGHEILHLATNEVIVRRNVTVVPITEAVIQAVELLAKKDDVYSFKIESKRGVHLYDSSTAGVDNEEDQDDLEEAQNEEDASVIASVSEEDVPVEDIEEYDQEVDQDDDEKIEEEEEEVDEEDLESELIGEDQPKVRRSERDKISRKVPNVSTFRGKTYGELFHQKTDDEIEYSVMEAQVMAFTMCQFNERVKVTRKQVAKQFLAIYSLKKAIHKYGKKGYDAALQEMRQLKERRCFIPISKDELKAMEKKRAMDSLIFLTEKKDGSIKARHCANGSTQRSYIDREEVSSPTVYTESTLLTAVIEAEERREVATCDIPNAFIQTEIEEKDHEGNRTIMKIKGVMVDMLCRLDSAYEEFVIIEKDVKVLYVHVLKAIYGMLASALLFYKKFASDLRRYGFVLNPYDPCVANKMVHDTQMTVSWHVDDLKVSHKEKKMVDEFIEWVIDTYGSIGQVKVTRGKVHEYLGMKLNYEVEGQVSCDMTAYVEMMIKDFPQQLEGESKIPWNDNLFKVSENVTKLDKTRAEQFHTVVAQGLFLCKRARPDISPAIAFLTTRVKNPDEEDWEKLVRMMKFLKYSRKDVLTLQANGDGKLKWYADASFAVHPDYKSHTGAIMTMGKGAVQSISRKQKMNSRSSTEAELIAADDIVGPMLWTKLFLESQGYPVKENILFQDNRSAILLEENGRKSAGKRSRHLNIRLFFITDQKEKGNLKIEFCPTDLMQGDYMSKPLHGRKFHEFRKQIMNLSAMMHVMLAAVVIPKG